MTSSSNQSQQQQPINYSADAPTTTSSSTTAKTPMTFDEDLFLFLPRLGDIIKRLGKKIIVSSIVLEILLSVSKKIPMKSKQKSMIYENNSKRVMI